MDGMTRQFVPTEAEMDEFVKNYLMPAFPHLCQSDPGDETDENV